MRRPWKLLRAGAAVLMLAGSALTAARAETKLTVSKAAADPALVMAEFGAELGIFKKHDLDITVPTIVQAKMVQAVIGGSVDIALASGATLAFIAKGAPLKAVAALAGPPRILVLVVRPDNSIASVDQLPGHTIAITNFGSLTDWAMTQLANSKGWKKDAVKLVAIGRTPAIIAAMKAKNVDGGVIDIGAALNLEEHGDAKIMVQFGDVIKNFLNQVIYASDKIIKENPAAVKNFLAAWFETIQYAKSHKAETVAYLQKSIHYSPTVASRAYDELFKTDFFSTDGVINPKIIEAMGQNFVEEKRLPKEVDLMQYVTGEFLPKK
jgi:NitT/TauT family transport system substrate-binding protein